MKITVFLLLVVFLLPFNSIAQSAEGTNKRERKVLRLINSLPEVVKENARRKRSHVPVLLRAYIQNTPDKDNKYYRVTVSEEKSGRLFTYDWYRVDPHTYEVKYDDIINGRVMSLAEWRRQRHKN